MELETKTNVKSVRVKPGPPAILTLLYGVSESPKHLSTDMSQLDYVLRSMVRDPLEQFSNKMLPYRAPLG